MKNSLNIYKVDLKNIATNWAAMILIGGLAILPSLYAWFNIAAMWDPYSNTGNLPIGIVNEDKGATVRDQEINAGKEIVDSLKDNKNMQWYFTDRKDAMDKVEYGDYFAIVIIPEDFSEKLGTVISDKPEKAQMEYFVNEKLNAVSPKITEKGASVIADEVSSKFISTVNGIIFDLFNNLGIEIEGNLPDIEKFEDYIFTLEENLPEINKMLNESLGDANSAGEILNKAQGALPQAKEYTNTGLTTINQTLDYMNEAENRLNSIAPKVKKDVAKVQSIADQINELLEKAKDSKIDISEGKRVQENLEKQLDDAITTLSTVEKALQQLQETNAQLPPATDGESGEEQETEQLSQDQINQAISQTADLRNSLEQLRTDVNQMDQFLNNTEAASKVVDQIHQAAANTNVKLDEFVKEYQNNIEPTILEEVGKAKETLTGAKGILVEIQSTLPEVEKVLTNTQKNLQEGKGMLEYASGEFPYVNDKIKQLAEKIRDVQKDTDINEIIQLLRNDPSAERSFFEEPVLLNQNALFPIENYGTGMTPFYTVLAGWVGALLLISLLAVDVHHDGIYTGRQVYFGRFFTFWTIGIVQTIVVTLGDLFLIGVNAKHPVWMVIFALLVSSVFILIVYSLVSVFGNVGKAMAIVLLVLQISGSGGTYPVQLLPKFFQAINPYLPFTYAVDLMREAVGGIVWGRALRDIGVLIFCGVLAIIFGAFLKEPINKKTTKFLEKSKESGLVH
ncbi:putative membrane protein [Lederbergia galactosidilyticus]|uniref:YhgE/Pip domain-containing protein n=1 Tax=Lederbergia galactosidilytica TaxID=217031 RepID=UPI001AE48A66|nr:YhgE/Pip domain-containing protein [Lederbergia galactosidilytica]MBP1914524.1 putative membrane protein [Lederbergia galactosidilytica]